MDIKQIVITMGILGLFIYSIMSFIVITQIDNNVENPMTNNDIINDSYGDLAVKLSSSEAETASDNFGQVPPTQQFGELEVTSIISPTKTAKTIIVGLWNIFIRLPQEVLGVSPIVATIINSILLIVLIIGIWAIWKGVVS